MCLYCFPKPKDTLACRPSWRSEEDQGLRRFDGKAHHVGYHLQPRSLGKSCKARGFGFVATGFSGHGRERPRISVVNR